MRTLFRAIGFLIVLGAIPQVLSAAWTPPAGFTRTPESFQGDAFAIAPDGKVAIGTASFGGGATIKVFQNAADAQAATSPIRTFTDPTYKFWGDLTFTNNDTLLFTENFDNDTAYRGTISTGASAPLAPVGSMPNAGGVVQVGSTIYCVAANGANANILYSVSGGTATAVVSNFGSGYAGGIAVDSSGNFLLTDSAGSLRRYTSSFSPLAPISLAGGNGSGAYDVAVDSEGDIFVTTNSTLTRIPFGTTTATQFGSPFGGAFAFISNLDYVGSGFEPSSGVGRLFINAVFGDDGAIIGATPSAIPEPATLAMLSLAIVPAFLRRRCRIAGAAALSACLFAGSIASTAQADHFFASKVISKQPGIQHQVGFTEASLALGAPRGGGGAEASTHVYNLGNGGYLTLGFDTANSQGHIVNGPGADFTVFENSFYADGDEHAAFAELMWVSVSTDGVYWARFEPTSKTLSPVPAYGTIDPDNVAKFAGVHPVYANADENAIDPFDPGVSGGDAFDLSDLAQSGAVTSGKVDLGNIRYVRLADVIGDGKRFDYVGRSIYDPTGPGSGGADVDAIAVINGVHLPEPAVALTLVAPALMRWRKIS